MTSWMDIIHTIKDALGVEYEHRAGLKFHTGLAVADDEPGDQTIVTVPPADASHIIAQQVFS